MPNQARIDVSLVPPRTMADVEMAKNENDLEAKDLFQIVDSVESSTNDDSKNIRKNILFFVFSIINLMLWYWANGMYGIAVQNYAGKVTTNQGSGISKDVTKDFYKL